MKHIIYCMICLLFMSCTVGEDTSTVMENYASTGLNPDYYGHYSGVWMVNEKNIGKAELDVDMQQVYTSLPLPTDVQQAITDKLGVKTLTGVEAGTYSVYYEEFGYSTASRCFDMMTHDYELKITANGQQHTIQFIMERGNAVGVFDKHTTAFVALFQLIEVRMDGETLKIYSPSQIIQFSSTKKTRTGGV